MKGLLFIEFIDFVESRFGRTLGDDMIASCTLASGGAYAATGTYDHDELVQMVGRLSTLSARPTAELLRGFGSHLLIRFAAEFPTFFRHTSVFDFLASIEGSVHEEVRKLYPDAELPSFTYERPSSDRLVMIYQSHRALADLAEGLIYGAIAHFGEAVQVQRDELSSNPQTTRFTLTRLPE